MRDWLQIDARFAALATALMLYGFAGSPTPDHPGWIEVVVGLLLILSVTLPGSHEDRAAFLPLLLVGPTIPLAVGFYKGYPLEAIARDVIPFLFLCLPVFIWPAHKAQAFFSLCLIVGVLFALRVLGQGLDMFPANAELLYLANSPLVVMSAIIGLGSAGMDLYRRDISVQSLMYLCGGLVCLLAMLIDVQRATIMAVILSLGALTIAGFIRAPRRMVWPLVLMLVAAFASHDIILTAWHSMATKTALVGVNARWLEVQAVYEHLSGDWPRVLFGIGWGGRFNSPAVGGWSVPYTHSLLTYMLLKTGWIGLGGTVLALGVCFRQIFHQRTLAALGLFWALVIPVFFYASYKSLDFGLVLVLALLLSKGMEFSKKKL